MMQSGTIYVSGKGKDEYGELGLHEKTLALTPQIIPELEHELIVDVACSSLHSLAINSHGQIWSWGCNKFGALGREGEETYPQPIIHPSMKYIKFKKVACGNSVSLAISTRNQLYAWGAFNSKSGLFGFLPSVQKQVYPRILNETAKLQIIDIAAGASHCLALDSRGHVYSWGCGELNQLGYETSRNWASNEQTLIPKKLPLADVVAIQCGAFHSLALTTFGQIYSWGLNHFQQCGVLESEESEQELDTVVQPTVIPYFQKKSVFKLSRKGKTKPRKRNADDAFASDDDDEPVTFQIEKSGEPLAISIAAGHYHSIAVMSNNSLVAWGRCQNGELGVPLEKVPGVLQEEETNQIFAVSYPYPNPIKFNETVKEIVAGASHTVAVLKNGQVWGYGLSSDGQFGIATKEKQTFLPVLVKTIAEKGKVFHAAAGGDFSFFLVEKGHQKKT